MGDAIPDRVIIAILRPFVRATRPVLDGLRESDPFGLGAHAVGAAAAPAQERGLRDKILDALATVQVPGSPAWAGMDVSARSRWWVYRVGRFTTLIAAVPGLGGALARRLPVSSAVGAAGQGLLLVAIAGEHGVRDEDELIELLGAVLFRRDLTVTEATETENVAAEDRAAELTGELARPAATPTVGTVARAVWRLGRALLAVEDELDKRPHGNILHEGLGMLPVVGAVGKYLGEWSGLKKAAREAQKRLAQR